MSMPTPTCTATANHKYARNPLLERYTLGMRSTRCSLDSSIGRPSHRLMHDIQILIHRLVAGYDIPVALFCQEQLPVGRALLVTGSARDDRVEMRGAAILF